MGTDSDITLNVDLNADDVKDTSQDLQQEIRNIFDMKDVPAGDAFERLKRIMRDDYIEADKLQQRLNELGGQRVETQEFIDIQKQIEQAQAKLAKLKDQMEKFLTTGGKEDSMTFKRMEYDAQQLEKTIEYAKDELQDLVDTGKAFTLGSESEDYTKTVEQLERVNNRMRYHTEQAYDMMDADQRANVATSALGAGFRELGKGARQAASKIADLVKQLLKLAATRIKNAVENMGKSIGLLSKHADSSNVSMKKLVTMILRYGFGIRSIYFAFRKLRKAVSEGLERMQEFEGHSGSLSNSINSLKTSLTYLSNSWAAAFAPIIEYVIPFINKLISALATLASYIGAFFAAFTGKSTMLKAKKAADSYADAAGGAAAAQKEWNNELYSFDELNKQQDKNKDSGGGGGTAGIADMFEEVPIDSILSKSVLDWIKRLKEAWKKSEFYKVGDILAEGLEAGLKKLDNWITNKFRPWGVKWAKNLAEVTNGFFEHWTLWSQLGKTVSNGIAAVLDIASTFLENVHWQSVGKAFGIFLDNVFNNKDMWDQIARFVSAKTNAVIDTIKGFLEETLPRAKAWGKTIGETIIKTLSGIKWQDAADNVVKGVTWLCEFIEGVLGDKGQWKGVLASIRDAFSYVVTNVDFARLGRDVSDVLTRITGFLASLDWYQVGYKIGQFLGNIDWPKILWDVGRSIVNGLWGAFVGFLTSDHGWQVIIGGALFLIIKGAITFMLAKAAVFLAGQLLLQSGIIGPLVQQFMAGLGVPFAAGAAQFGVKGQTALGAALAGIKTKLVTALTSLAKVVKPLALGVADALLVAYDAKSLVTASKTYNEAQQTHNKETEKALGTFENLYKTKGPEVAAQWAKMAYDIDVSGKSLEQGQSALVGKIESLWDGVPQNMWEGFKQGWMSYFGEGGTGLFGLFGDAFTGAINGIKALLGIASPSTVFFDIGVNLVQGLINGVQSLWNTFVNLITSGLSAIGSFFSTVWGEVQNATKNAWNFISSHCSKIWKDLSSSATNIFNNIKTTVSKKFNELKTNLVTTASNIQSSIKSKWNSVKTTASSMWSSISSTVKSKWMSLRSMIAGVEWSSIGRNLVTGIQNGVGGAWDALVSTVHSLCSSLLASVRSFFGIASPSKVFAEIGKYLDAGLARGILEDADKPQTAIDSVNEQLLDAANSNSLNIDTDIAVSKLDVLLAKLTSVADTFASISTTVANMRVPDIAVGNTAPPKSTVSQDASDSYIDTFSEKLANELATVLQSVRSTGTDRQNIQINIGRRAVFDAVVEENNDRIVRTGTSPLFGL